MRWSVHVKRVRAGARIPARAHPGDACVDAWAAEHVLIPPGAVCKVALGFALEMSPGLECQVRPRSGMSMRGVLVQLGTVDSGYRGEVSAVVLNASGGSVEVGLDTRIAQLAFRRVIDPEFVEVAELSESSRGDGGFGSTGGGVL